MPTSGTVMVTGASGFVASHTVKLLLEHGFTVHATVRDPADESKVAHIKSLPYACERLKIYAADLSTPGCFDRAIVGCNAVVHMATPIGFGPDPKETIYKPTIAGTEALMSALDKAEVEVFVLTSSRDAADPDPEPEIKSEDGWTDHDAKVASGNWYPAAKTRQEEICAEGCRNRRVRFVAILPTGVLGPVLQPKLNATMSWFRGWCTGEMPKAPNMALSLVDVRDVAALHVAGLENADAVGRYFAIAQDYWHFNDILTVVKELWPPMPPFEKVGGELARCSRFDFSRRDQLLPGYQFRDMRSTFADALASLKDRGEL